MAQIILCDWTLETGQPHSEPADAMVTNIANGDVLAYCTGHLFAWCAQMAGIAEAETDATAADANERLGKLSVLPESSGEDEAAGESDGGLPDVPQGAPSSPTPGEAASEGAPAGIGP